MDQLSRGDVSLCFEDVGRGGPPIVLVHGFACDHTCLAPHLDYFRRQHRVVAVDLRGHGESGKPKQDYTVGGFAEDLAWLCYELGVYEPIIVGHGYGGMVALECAARHPDLPAAIVALDSVVVPAAWADALLQLFTAGRLTAAQRALLRQFIARLFVPADDRNRVANLVDSLSTLPQEVAISIWENALVWDSGAAADACRVPVLYIEAGPSNSHFTRLGKRCKRLMIRKVVGATPGQQSEVSEQVNAMIERFLTETKEGASATEGTLASNERESAHTGEMSV